MKIIGIKILESMINTGFLLTPEPIDWNQHLGIKGLRLVNQKRFCFTYIEPKELDKHCEKFGLYSLQFDEDAIRELGALPAFYVPSVKLTDNKIIYPSQFLLKNIIIATETLKHQRKKCVYGIMGILGLLCPTEYKERKQDPLENFKLREWRITGDTIRFLESQNLVFPNLSNEEYQKLKQINPIWGTSGQTTPLKFHRFKGRHVLSYAKYLVTPDDPIIVKEARDNIDRLEKAERPKAISKSKFKEIHEISD